VLGAVAGGLVLLAPYQAEAAQPTSLPAAGAVDAGAAVPSAPQSITASGAAGPLYAVDNPAQPGDAFPNSPFAGGTD
jgi:hypothetical protein